MSDTNFARNNEPRVARVRRATSKVNYTYDIDLMDSEDEEELTVGKASSSKKRVDADSDEEDAYAENQYIKQGSEDEEEEYEESDEDERKVEAPKKGARAYKSSKGPGSSLSSSSSPRSRLKKKRRTIIDEPFEVPPVDEVLKVVRKDRASLEKRLSKDSGSSSSSAGKIGELLKGVTEVKDLDTTEVSDRIEKLIVDTVLQILQKNEAFEYMIPNRAASNQRYIEGLDRVCLGENISKRAFLNASHVRKTAITTRVIELCHEVLAKQIHITKRDLFYTDVKLFKEQRESDAVLDDVACMVGCTRTSLHVVASDKGLVVGRIQYKEAGDEIDCTKMGIGGKAIPPYIEKITDIRSDAEFIILVEKEAAYMRLAEDRVYKKYPCIIITGKGQPDVATRLFLRKVRDTLKIPVLALVDSDPYGLKILSVYSSGSKAMSYDSSNLTTSDIKWLGVRPSDLNKFNLPQQCRLPLTDNDRKMGEELLKEEFIQKNPEWVAELQIMLDSGEKAEIQALSSFGFQYITETFLPQKLTEGDWI